MQTDYFYARTVDVSGCWVWTLAKNKGGYGRLRHKGRSLLAHRASYETFVGPIPEGLELDHSCHRPPCVNPAHLSPATSSQNKLTRRPRTHCKRNHPFDEENTANWKTQRACKTCRRELQRERRQRNADAS